jgi:hypothetical protein
MEINITSFDAPAFDYSHSIAEGGTNAARNTWNAALNGPRLLTTDAALDAMRAWAGRTGAWEETEIAAWDDTELNALFVQLVSGDIREAGADCLAGIDWAHYAEDSEAGQISGCMFQGDDGQIYYYLGE